MASVTVVHPRGETTRVVSSVTELNAYVINRGWTVQAGAYADAYQTLTGQTYAPPTTGGGSFSPGRVLDATGQPVAAKRLSVILDANGDIDDLIIEDI